jgi:hypothetical protein
MTGQFDIRADAGLAASGIHEKFQYQVNGSGNWIDVVPGQWLTSFADQSVYGNSQTVTYRACREAANDDYCGPVSAGTTLTPVNARAALVSCVVGSLPVSTAPANAGAPTVTLLYSYSRGVVGTYPDASFSDWSATEAAPPPNLLSDQTAVRVKARVQYGAGPVHEDPHYDEGYCAP